jgi:uncharacterized protein YigA (DUF484 family)
MSDRAESRAPAEAAAEAVKAYIRMNRTRLAADSELLALLLPERFDAGEVRDLQKFVIEKLATENTALRAERDGLRGARVQAVRLGEGVRRATLDLLDARSFEEAIAIAIASADAFGAERAALCVEGEEGAAPTGTKGVRLIEPGTIAAVLGREGMGAILSGGGEILLGPGGGQCRSLAAFRLKIGRDTPAALYVLGAQAEGRFEGDETETDLTFFARALERSIRAWLDLPKL